MKRLIQHNIALVLTVSVLVVITIFGSAPTHSAAAPDLASATVTSTRITPPVRPTKTATTTPTATPDTTRRLPKIAFVAGHNGVTGIFTMDPDGSNIVQITHSAEYKLFPTWSPNGKLIAYLVGVGVGKPPILKIMNADGSNSHQIQIGKGVAVSPPAWSPDSGQIAYISVRSKPEESGLYIFDLTTNREHKLTTSASIDYSFNPPTDDVALTDAYAPSWSPDGKKLLVFAGLDGAPKTTLVTTLDGQNVTPLLAQSDAVAINASWSPDGSQVLFMSLHATGNFTRVSIDIMNVSDNTVSEFPPQPKVIPFAPTWSPDGTQIVFTGVSFTTEQSRIYVVNADWTGLQQLTQDKFSQGDAYPSWGMVPVPQAKH